MDGSDAIQYILNNNIEGCIIECGVGGGDFEYIWIQELIKNNTKRDIYLFDTFGGLVRPSEFDYTCEDAIRFKMNSDHVLNMWETQIIDNNTNGWCYVPLSDVQQRLNKTGYPESNLHYIVGDVLKTLQIKENIPDKIAILRLDTDWYESSKIELEKLYNNVVIGGVIIFDDYYHWNGQRKAVDDFLESINETYDFVNIGNYKTAAIIKK